MFVRSQVWSRPLCSRGLDSQSPADLWRGINQSLWSDRHWLWTHQYSFIQWSQQGFEPVTFWSQIHWIRWMSYHQPLTATISVPTFRWWRRGRGAQSHQSYLCRTNSSVTTFFTSPKSSCFFLHRFCTVRINRMNKKNHNNQTHEYVVSKLPHPGSTRSFFRVFQMTSAAQNTTTHSSHMIKMVNRQSDV